SRRLSVLDAKLLTQTDCPAGETEGAVLSVVRAAIRMGSPTFLAELTLIRTTVPSSWSVTNREPAAATSPFGFLPTRIGSPSGRSDRASRRRTTPPASSANQTLRPVTVIPAGDP